MVMMAEDNIRDNINNKRQNNSHVNSRMHNMKRGRRQEPPGGGRGTGGGGGHRHQHNDCHSTRLCVRNLPREVTDKDVRQFVLGSCGKYYCGDDDDEGGGAGTTELRLTDCRVLKGRRMAFVGVATPRQADYLMRKLDRSYFRTCKLVVERAYKQHQQNHHHQHEKNSENSGGRQAAEAAKGDTSKTTHDAGSRSKDKATKERELKKKKEFLAVMGVAADDNNYNNAAGGGGKDKGAATSSCSARKFWANDDDDDVGGAAADAGNTEKKMDENEGEENDEGDRESSSSASDSDSNSDGSTSDDDDDDDDDVDDADPLVQQHDSEKKKKTAAAAAAAASSKAMTDMDFLRSKQVPADDLAMDGGVEEEPPRNEDDDDREEDKNNNDGGDDGTSSSSDSSDSDSSDGPTRPEATKTHLEAEIHEHGGDDGATKAAATTTTPDNTTTTTTGRRIFVRNLPFSATEDEIMGLFSNEYDLNVEACYVPVDDLKRPKGFGFVTFSTCHDAQRALEVADGCDFQGRLLHLLPAAPAPNEDGDRDATTEQQDGANTNNLSYRQRQEKTRREQAIRQTTGWSASYVRGDAVVDTLAERLGLRKGDILAVRDGLSSGDAAVRLALGETAIIEENRKYFAEHGIDMEALVSVQRKESDNDDGGRRGKALERSKKSILVKNLPADTTEEELHKIFGSVGSETPSKILLPPSRTIAVVEYSHGNDAVRAFRRLAYRRFKSVPLYLEWAPLASRVDEPPQQPSSETTKKQADLETTDTAIDETVDLLVSSGPTPTIMIKNLNFKTSEDQLRKFFSKHVGDIRAVRIPQKTVPIKRVRTGAVHQPHDGGVRTLSMGYGFAEFSSQESAKKVLRTLQGSILDGHTLQLMPSSKTQGSSKIQAPPSSGKDPAKLLVRNVPFQASRSELLKLFGSFGQLRKVRLPKKFDGTHRGFAFVEYLTGKEAAEAMKSLSRTHLYGRHLVIEWASADEDEDLNKLREKAKRNISSGPAAPPLQNKKIRFD